MLQVLHLDVLKIDRVLHMECAWKTGGTSGPHAVLWHERRLGQHGPAAEALARLLRRHCPR